MKRSRDRYRTNRDESKKKETLLGDCSPGNGEEAEAANVRYFLHALNQLSLALHALGYATEGAALANVKVDLNNRLFNPAGKMVEIASPPN